MASEGSSKIVFLGTGTPRLNADRCPPSAAVIAGGRAVLVDAGAGVVHRASQACRLGVSELEPRSIHHVFLTHLHSDHTLGLPDLIFSPWVVGRREPLRIYGPEGTKEMVDCLLSAYKVDIKARTLGLEHNMSGAELTRVEEIAEGFKADDDVLVVEAFQAEHGDYLPSLAYRFETADRTIVFSGDTRPCPGIEAAADGAQVLVHEVYAADEVAVEDRAGGDSWPQYLAASHTSSRELGELASRLDLNLLILNHLLRRHTTDDELSEEIRRAGCNCQIAVAKDLDIF